MLPFNEKISKKFLDSFNKSLGQIVISNEYKINSFFIQFKTETTKKYYFLVCLYDDILEKEITSQKNINILVNTKKFEINLNPKERIIKCLKDEKIIAIEIFKSDKISREIDFLYCDLNYVYGYNIYKDQHVFILNSGDANAYGGMIEEINDSNFKYSSNFSKNVFLPIFLTENSRIVGIHLNNENQYKIGKFIGSLLKLFNERYYKRELKLNLNTLYKLSKSMCILRNIDVKNEDEYSSLGLYLGKGYGKEREFLGFFIYLGNDLNFLLTEHLIDEISVGKNDTYEIKIYNNKLYYIKLDRKERIIRCTGKYTIIQILNKDIVKKEIEFLLPELNYNNNDYYDYKGKEILILNLKKKNLTKSKNSTSNNNVNNYKYRCDISKIIEIPNAKKKDSFFSEKEKFEIEFREKQLGEFENGYGIVILIDSLKAFGIINNLLEKEIYFTINEIHDNIFNYKNQILIGTKLSFKTINNVAKSMCKVNFGPISFIGFFVKISKKREYYFLITKSFTIEFILKNKFQFSLEILGGKKFSIKYNEKRIMINDIPIGIIEILDSDEIKNDIYFLSCDLEYFSKYNEYNNKDILIVRYSKNFDDIIIANGKILKKDIGHFYYISDIGPNCEGAPVLLNENSKVIGRHSLQADYGESIFYGSQLELSDFSSIE